MSTATSKIQLIIELKNKMTAGLNNAKKAVNSSVKDIKDKVSNLKTHHSEALNAMTDHVPMLGNAMSLLGNPYALAAAGAVALATAAVKLFNHLMEVSLALESNKKTIKTLFEVSGAELQKLTSISTATAKVFGVEHQILSEATNALAKEYADLGLTGEQAFRLVQQGMIATDGKLDLNQLREYSSQMKLAGVSAEEMIAISAKSYKLGIYDDKGLDAIKEGNLRLAEMTTAASDALNVFRNKKGVTFDVDTLKKSLKTGEITTFDAMKRISESMQFLDVAAKQQVIADIFGGPGEDAGAQFFETILGTKNAMSDIINIQDKSVKNQMQRLALEEKIADKQQAFSGDFKALADWWDIIKLKAQVFFYDVMGKAVDWIKFKIAQFKLMWELIKQPFLMLYNAFEGLSKLVNWVFSIIGKAIDWIYNKLGGEGSLIEKLFGGAAGIWTGIKSFFDNLTGYIERVTTITAKAFEVINYALSGQFGKMKESWNGLKNEFSKGLTLDKPQTLKQQTESQKEQKAGSGKNPTSPLNDNNSLNLNTSPTTDSISTITQNAANAQPKSITINIGSFVEKMEISKSAAAGMSWEEIERKMREMLLRLTNDVATM